MCLTLPLLTPPSCPLSHYLFLSLSSSRSCSLSPRPPPFLPLIFYPPFISILSPLFFLQKATGGLTDAQVIGAGGFGLVYKGTINGRAVAVKVLDAQSSQGDREFQAEVQVLSRLQSPYLVRLHGYCAEGTTRILVYDFMANGSLEDLLHDKGTA